MKDKNLLLPFAGPKDIVLLAAQIEIAWRKDNLEFEKILIAKSIKFHKFPEGGFSVDIEDLSDEEINAIKNKKTPFLDEAYEKHGVMDNDPSTLKP